MQGSDKAQTQEELDAQWVKRGKKYKAKYFGALKELFKEVNNDKDCQVQDTKHGYGEGWEEMCCPLRGRGSDKAGGLGT